MKLLYKILFFSNLLISATSEAHAISTVVRLPFGDHKAVLNYAWNYLPPNPVIIDAGAYDGTDSLQMSQYWPNAQIHSFEPVPELFAHIKSLAAKNGNIHPYQVALSDQNGTATFYLSTLAHDPSRILGSSSLLPPKEHLIEDPWIQFPSILEVQTVTLDSWAETQKINHVDFLWLDMQGFELNMIKASKLAQNARAIWMEVEFTEVFEGQYQFKDIKDWMEANGFVLAACDFDIENPEHYFGNVMFLNRKPIDKFVKHNPNEKKRRKSR
ncbi:MAG: FkbM family methyltransferase [Verrucomicrobia bacterium]|nr:FkbM family methyltransferase [Verrucomicrobiota bacterium]